jgi:hypothetical protein
MTQRRLRPSQGGKMFSKPVPGLSKMFEENDFVTFRCYFNGQMRQVFGWIDGVDIYDTPGLMRLQEARTGESIYFVPGSSGPQGYDVRKLVREPVPVDHEYPTPNVGDIVVVLGQASLLGRFGKVVCVREGWVEVSIDPQGSGVHIFVPGNVRVIPPAPPSPWEFRSFAYKWSAQAMGPIPDPKVDVGAMWEAAYHRGRLK